MAGVGAYFRTLREKQGISRAWVAERAGTTETSLYRIEQGLQKPGLEIMLGIIDAVRGSVGDVRELLKSKEANGKEGEQRADDILLRLSDRSEYRIAEHVGEFSTDELEQIRSALANDPGFLDVIARAISKGRT